MQANASGLPYHQLLNQITIMAVQTSNAEICKCRTLKHFLATGFNIYATATERGSFLYSSKTADGHVKFILKCLMVTI
jgi:hypothetical protein